MFSSPTPAPGSRTIANNALRSAGLMDRDTTMRDLTDRPGGRKGSSKTRSHTHRSRAPDLSSKKDLLGGPRPGPSRVSSSHSGPSDPLAIRGAARPTLVGRIRRNAVSATAGSSPVIRTSAAKAKLVDQWRDVVKSRYDPETRFLNLESLVDHDLVKKLNLMAPGYGGDARHAGVLYKIASQLKPKVQTLSLASNNLVGEHLTYIHHYLPDLVNLSLQNNNIRSVKELDCISQRKQKMLNLRELVLLGNPVRELEYQNGRGDRYRQIMAQRFSSLQVLDQEPIAQISFDVPQSSTTSSASINRPTATKFPSEMGASFVTGVDGSIVSNFLLRFFTTLDTRRTELLDAYDPAATFSYSLNTTVPARARLQGFQYSRDMPNQTKLNWKPWMDGGMGGSRNLTRIGTGAGTAVKSFHIGAEQAVKALADLPATKHDIGGPPEKFCIDSFPVVHGQGMGLLLTVHGQFTEVGTEGIRSFDRSFILAPAHDGSRAKINGWEVVILSDQWTIRAYSSHEAWKPGPMLVQALTRQQQAQASRAAAQAQQPELLASSLALDQQAALTDVPEMQRPLVLQICARTSLNVKFAVDCLTGNGWDLDRAIANFNEVKVSSITI
ncbi:NTF2-like protein [Tricholoma matsutake]|nr:NTF2-like protein [Tricholoma matsutake 945]